MTGSLRRFCRLEPMLFRRPIEDDRVPEATPQAGLGVVSQVYPGRIFSDDLGQGVAGVVLCCGRWLTARLA